MSKAFAAAAVFMAVLAVGAVLVAREFRAAQERPGAERVLDRERLERVAAAIAAYRRAHGDAWPRKALELHREQGLPLADAGVRYRMPPPDAADDYVVCWMEVLRSGARRGEPWGAAGQVADRDIPPASLVLTKALRIEELDEAAWRARTPADAAR